jgi:hypothetical protein
MAEEECQALDNKGSGFVAEGPASRLDHGPDCTAQGNQGPGFVAAAGGQILEVNYRLLAKEMKRKRRAESRLRRKQRKQGGQVAAVKALLQGRSASGRGGGKGSNSRGQEAVVQEEEGINSSGDMEHGYSDEDEEEEVEDEDGSDEGMAGLRALMALGEPAVMLQAVARHRAGVRGAAAG